MHQDSPEKRHLHVKITEDMYRMIEVRAEELNEIPAEFVRRVLDSALIGTKLSDEDHKIINERIRRNTERIRGHAD